MTRTPRSLLSAVVPAAITVLGAKREFSSAERTLRRVAKDRARPKPFAPPSRLRRSVDIERNSVNGWPVYTLTPKSGRGVTRALYAHGGAWIHEISPFHWRMMAKLAVATGTEFTVPIYPLAPLGTAGTVVPGFADLAAELVAEVGADRVVLMGDSAGGTIVLATAMLLRERRVPPPRDIVLISPGLDLSLRNPLIPVIQPKDPWLAVPGLRAAADLWRADLPLDDPQVSPLVGSLAGLGRITLFTGTHDILNADAHLLVRTARAEGQPLDLYEKPNMLHVYPMLPIPEGAEALRVIAGVLSR